MIKLHEFRLPVVLSKNILVHLEVDRPVKGLKLLVVESSLQNRERQVVFQTVFTSVAQVVDLLETLYWDHEFLRLSVYSPCYLNLV